MSREMLKGLIDLVPDEDIEAIYKVIIKFIPEVIPEPDEIEAIMEAKADKSPTVSHEDIFWN